MTNVELKGICVKFQCLGKRLGDSRVGTKHDRGGEGERYKVGGCKMLKELKSIAKKMSKVKLRGWVLKYQRSRCVCRTGGFMGCEKNKNQRWKECEVKLDDVDKWGVRKKWSKADGQRQDVKLGIVDKWAKGQRREKNGCKCKSRGRIRRTVSVGKKRCCFSTSEVGMRGTGGKTLHWRGRCVREKR